MLLRLQRFNLVIKYKPGSQMYVADHLSRVFLSTTEEFQEEAQIFTMELEATSPMDSIQISPDRLALLQNHTRQDEVLQALKTTVLSGWPESRG